MEGHWQRPTGVVLGHEGAAAIEAVGDAVEERFPELRPGVLVVLAWTAPCGTCHACRRGEGWLCERPIGSGHRLAERDVRVHRANGSRVGAYSGIGTLATRQVVAAEAAIAVDPRTPARSRRSLGEAREDASADLTAQEALGSPLRAARGPKSVARNA